MASMRRLLVAATVLPALAWAAGAHAAAPTSVVEVTVDNSGQTETMKLDKSSVPAGPVQFVVKNASFDEAHEMIVARTDLKPANFPTHANGSRVTESKFEGLGFVVRPDGGK
jgi:hypothetical protein